jgi:membrane associated rhomboid family serine protease
MRDPESGLAALPRFWKIPVIQEATPFRSKRLAAMRGFIRATERCWMKTIFIATAVGLAVGLAVLFIGRTLFDSTNASVAAAVGGAVCGLVMTRFWAQRASR